MAASHHDYGACMPCRAPLMRFIEVQAEYLVKAIVVGDESVGKSCLQQVLAGHVCAAQYTPTIGVEVIVHRCTVDDASVKVISCAFIELCFSLNVY